MRELVLRSTCNTDAPAWRNCSPLSAESMPPVARTGKPGIALAMAETALRAMGLMALPANIVDYIKSYFSVNVMRLVNSASRPRIL